MEARIIMHAPPVETLGRGVVVSVLIRYLTPHEVANLATTSRAMLEASREPGNRREIFFKLLDFYGMHVLQNYMAKDAGAREFFARFPDMDSLVKEYGLLRFWNVYMDKPFANEEAFRTTCRALAQNRVLEWLTFFGQAMSNDYGVRVLLREVPNMHRLRVLGVERSSCKDLYLLATINTIQILKLESCGLTDADAISIAGALEKNTSLLDVDLVSNRFSDDGANALLKMFNAHKTLEILHIAGNQVSSAMFARFEAINAARYANPGGVLRRLRF